MKRWLKLSPICSLMALVLPHYMFVLFHHHHHNNNNNNSTSGHDANDTDNNSNDVNDADMMIIIMILMILTTLITMAVINNSKIWGRKKTATNHCWVILLKGSRIVWYVFCLFFSLFRPFSLLFAFWSWKVPFQQYLQHVWIRNSHFPLEFATFWCYLQHFGAGSCHVNNICRFLEPIIFHGHRICNILVLELFIEHGSLQLRFI